MSERYWRGRRVVVTGAAGFIASHLVEELARAGARVRALARYNSRSHRGFLQSLDSALASRVEVCSGDLTDPYFVDGLVDGAHTVFHLGALIGIPYSYAAPAHYVETNVRGTLHVLEACLRRRVAKVVHTSTSEVYGTALYVPIDERHPRQPQSPYAATKLAADALAESFHRSFGLPVAIARPFNTFGPRQSARAVIPSIGVQLLNGAACVRVGDTAPVRDFNYVLDTVAGLIAVGRSPRSIGTDVNIGSGRGVTVARVAELMMKACGRRVPLRGDPARMRPKKSEVMRLVCDRRKAGRLLGWRPRWTLERGLAETLAYLRDHAQDYAAGRYDV